MGDTAPSPAVIRRTQDLLGKYVKKPVLSEKLLRKPPFRFLHDVINVVIQDTGFLGDVYTAEELVYDNVKEKDAKIDFLQKLIDAVSECDTTKRAQIPINMSYFLSESSSTDGTSIKARPSKIVAGHEPERTNELLQAIGRALDGASSSSAIIGNNNASAPAVATKDTGRKKPAAAVVDAVPSKTGTTNNKLSTKKPSTKSVSTDLGKKSTKTVRNAETKETKGAKAAKGSKATSVPSKETNVVRPTKPNPLKEKQASVEAKPVVEIVDDVVDVTQPELVDAGAEDVGQSETFVTILETQQNSITASASMLADAFQPTVVNVQEMPTTSDTSNIVADDTTATTAPLIKPGESNELIDVIDQEAELRRRERSARKTLRSERRKSSGHSSVVQPQPETSIVPSSVSDEHPPLSLVIADEPKLIAKSSSSSKKHRKSGPVLAAAPAVDHSDAAETSDTIAAPPTAVVRPRTSLRPPSVRPASARPGAPRRRERNVEVVLPPDEQQTTGSSSSNVGASGGAADAFGVDLDDDADNLIVIEDAANVADEALMMMDHRMGDGADKAMMMQAVDSVAITKDDAAAQGHLVQQILQTQKQFAKSESETDGSTDKNGTVREMYFQGFLSTNY